MGWNGGSRLFEKIIETVSRHVPDKVHREAIYFHLIPAFEDMDCDTLHECVSLDSAFDNVLKFLHPDYFD